MATMRAMGVSTGSVVAYPISAPRVGGRASTVPARRPAVRTRAAGGSIGGGDQRKWTFESIVKATSNFTSFKEWRKKDQNSYDAAHRLNLLDNENVTGHLKKEIGSGIIWTPEKILVEAKKYDQAGLFAKKSSSAFQASLRLNLYKEISKTMCWRKNLSKTIRERRNYA